MPCLIPWGTLFATRRTRYSFRKLLRLRQDDSTWNSALPYNKKAMLARKRRYVTRSTIQMSNGLVPQTSHLTEIVQLG